MENGLRPPTAPRDDTSAEAGTNPNLKLYAMLALVLVVLLLVVLVLPSVIPDPVNEKETDTSVVDQQTTVVPPTPAAVPDHLRIDAEKALQDFLRLRAQPDLGNADLWAADAWQEAFNSADRGDEEFGRGDFAAALGSYKDAGAQLQNILDNRDSILGQNLEAGWQFLKDNAVEDATAAFERVLAMEPGHPQASLGLGRSLVREQVLELVLIAKQAEISNELPVAAEAYTNALQLDPLYLPAREALDEIQAELRNRAFQDSLGRALRGIEKGQFTTAEKALSAAAKIHPADEAIKDARQRLEAARREASLASLRKEAEGLENAENWMGANGKYRQALSIDSKAAFARNGSTRSEKKIRLHRQLDHYLADTTRLYSDEPLNNARELLAANPKPATGEPLLAGKLARLDQAVKLAVIPVDLLIISDNLTEVSIYKVGRLGTFGQKQLSLRPGKYTVTGSRRGYRDVLKVVELKPGMQTQSLEIRTEEQI